MSKERNRDDRNNQAEVFDLMIHGICRGWLQAPHQALNGSENPRLDTEGGVFSKPTPHRLRRHTFSTGTRASVAAAILAIAVVASGFVKLTLMDNAETAAGFEPARFVADADDSLPLP